MQPASKHRRRLLGAAMAAPLVQGLPASGFAQSVAGRVRPGEPGWPTDAGWAALRSAVGGRLTALRSPFDACRDGVDPACARLFDHTLKNPYAIGDDPALTQTLGWVDAWTSQPSAYAVEARTDEDVVAAVNFARERRLRLVVKGGGHGYQGTSSAPDSLLVWTRRMNQTVLHEDFVPAGCDGRIAPQRAVTVGAGAIWSQAYDAVTTQGGGYVQGGGCLTVGVAGLVQSGGFGSFSKAFGLASASLLEARVITADGEVRTVNACTEPDLFWALKGGGGGSFGIVTRLTLRVHPLPEPFGAVNMTVKARSPEAFRRLVGRMADFCATALINPSWGEQIRLRPDNTLRVSMVFQGIGRGEAQGVWQPFIDAVASAPQDFWFESAPFIVSTSARDFWAPTLVKKTLGFIKSDARPGAPKTNVFWPGDEGQAGQVVHAYDSAWLPAALLQPGRRAALADSLFAASRLASLSLHFNKGLAGAPPEALAAARDTAVNPAVLDAFALVILATTGRPAYPGVPGREPDAALARRQRDAIGRATAELHKLVLEPGAYLAESNYFEPNWQRAFWGANYPRLLATKRRYDPDGLFMVHHGVGSESWSADGFTRRA